MQWSNQQKNTGLNIIHASGGTRASGTCLVACDLCSTSSLVVPVTPTPKSVTSAIPGPTKSPVTLSPTLEPTNVPTTVIRFHLVVDFGLVWTSLVEPCLGLIILDPWLGLA